MPRKYIRGHRNASRGLNDGGAAVSDRFKQIKLK